MGQKDIEKFAFLFLCGKKDRDILLGKARMTFSDFDRLTYLTGCNYGVLFLLLCEEKVISGGDYEPARYQKQPFKI